MKTSPRLAVAALVFALAVPAGFAQAATRAYKVVAAEKVGGAGGFDYVTADPDGRRLYVPRGAPANHVNVFDLDTLKPVGEIPETAGVHGAAIDAKSHHGFSSSRPVVMWDTQTLATIKTIAVEGNPDGILFEPFTERVYVLSHRAPNVTVLDAKDGSIVGTIDLGGAPEQGQSDGQGRVFIDVEDKANVAVVDAKTLKVTAHYDLSSKASTPAGLALDIKNRVLFACCREPATCVVLNADDGKILASLPLAGGSDGAVFNPATMEAFSSHGNGTLSVIKENSPTSFEIEQTVTTRNGAKTCTLDPKTNRILLITADRAAAPAQPESPPAGGEKAPAGRRGGGRGGAMVPDSFTILAVAR
jgi:DNA-binding beta-propeller fold protein YncE